MKSRHALAAISALFLLASAASAPAADRGGSGWPWIGKDADRLEIKLGGAFYDTGVLTQHQEDGFTLNGEVLLPSPAFLSRIGSPRPYVGGNLSFPENGNDGVDFAFAGLNWQAHWTNRFYTSASIGGAINNADFSNPSPNHWGLGCHALFHLGLSAGFDVSERVSVEVYGDHFSNAGLCSTNGGMEMTGMRVGLKF